MHRCVNSVNDLYGVSGPPGGWTAYNWLTPADRLAGMTDPADLPPHLVEPDPQMQATSPRPIEGSTAHFRAHGRCYAACVVDVISTDPLSPDFLVDLIVFAPRDKTNRDRFTKVSSLPGTVRWANDLSFALPETDTDGTKTWAEKTWHFPGRHCLPEVVLSGAAN